MPRLGIESANRKQCSKCAQVLPISEFWKKNSRSLRGWCKDCVREWSREHYRKFPDKHKAKEKRIRIQKIYGISVKEYESLRAKGCSICGSQENISLDHCHKYQKPREALCNLCNRALGLMREDVSLLARMIEYIEYWKVKNAEQYANN